MLSVYLQMIETEEDRSKFTIMYTQYRNLMYVAAFEILKNIEDAEDAVHQAFCKVAEHMEKIGEPISSKTKCYLLTIVENRAIDVNRVESKHQHVPFDDETMGYEVEYTGRCELAACFAKLPARYREILNLKYQYGFSNREIAKMLGITLENANKLEQRAKAKLYELCEKEGVLV